MLGFLRYFLKKRPSRGEVVSGLRLTFLLAFSSQLFVALLLGALLALLTTPQTGKGSLLAQVLVVLSLLWLPLALLTAHLVAGSGGKRGAIAATIALGVILATPAWFILLAWLAGSALSYLLLLGVVLMVSYGLGFFLVGGYARRALAKTDEERA